MAASSHPPPADLPLRCACGALRGVARAASARTGVRMLCYCDDCQAYARFLGQPGLLDEWGGTDLFQLAPATLSFTGGSSALSCVRFSKTGLYRFYCAECHTPVGNSVGPRFPCIGLALSFMDPEANSGARTEQLGEPTGFLHTQFALGGLPNRDPHLLRIVAKCSRLIAKWWLTGARSPSPFYTDDARAPRVEPRVLSAEERAAL